MPDAVQSWSLVDDDKHGPLPAFLLALTAVTGLVDAVSILSLGRVFVANMTGNVVFVAFALAGAAGFSLAASLSALGGFVLGAGIGGWLAIRFHSHRGKALLAGCLFELTCVLAGLVLILSAPDRLPAAIEAGSAGVVAMALGIQNAVVRSLAVPDLTTTVLTLTLTGLAADVRRRLTPAAVRRILAVTTMFSGAVVGAVLVLRVDPAAALGVAAGLLAAVALSVRFHSRTDRPWHQPPGG